MPSHSKAHLDIRHDGDMVHVTFPTGRVDGTAVTTLYEASEQLIGGPQTRLLVDLSGIDHISSAGVGIMVALKRRAMTEGARFHLAVPSQVVRGTFEIMHLDQVLEIFPTPDAAKAAFKA